VPNFEAIATTVAEIFCDISTFQDGGRRHRGFLNEMFNGRTAQEGRTASPCQICSKSVKPRPRYGPPSWICVCSDHQEGHLMVVFIAVQNLVGIDAVILIICTFLDFTSLA